MSACEDVADSRKQHREQLVELQVRERRIGDRLHVLEPLPCPGLRLEGPGMIDRNCGAVADELQQLHVVLVEDPGHERSHMEDAKHSRRRRAAARRAST